MKLLVALLGFVFIATVYAQSTPYIQTLFGAEQTCGKGTPINISNKRLTSNTNVAKGNFGWHVLIKQNGNLICSGAMITNMWVITTAYCVYNKALTSLALDFGVQDRQIYDSWSIANRAISKIIIHSSYAHGQFKNDIAMLKLSGNPITFDTFTYRIINICVPNGQLAYEGRYGYLTGYGSQYSGGPTSRYLMQLYMPHLHGSVCYNNHASYYYVDQNTQICAGGQNQDFCDGDAGGPYSVLGTDGRWHLVGIASFGRNPCGSGGVYTKISAYVNFIYTTVQTQ